ncbi:MAG: SPOR domain-containing protein [Acidobacteriota bacterium]|nr:SPOR domain-containing protein [Acidobacteriota bacterium]
MRSREQGARRIVEIELDLPRLAFGAFLLIVAIVAAFFVGRAVGRRAGAGGGPAAATVAGGAASGSQTVEDVSGGKGLFDRVGDGGTERVPGRQVTEEAALAGGLELDLGTAPSRNEAERIKALASSLGWPAVVAGDARGGYRVAAGPFATRQEAQRAARQLEEALGRPVALREDRR